jgi:hypothetical protein
VISQPAGVPGEIWELDDEVLSCPVGTARESQISAVVTDDRAVAAVTASWTIGGSTTSVAMVANGSTYTATFGPFPYPTVPDTTPDVATPIAIVIDAADVAGNTAKTAITVDVYSLFQCFG